ncbi:protoporphyrinogen/coproporphyrinogen oxidase [Spirulina sp. 06S082]|uniref:protoporphyrinogen/coproporphyrinogen oxidase n=1 Tax=Spirulina sp. 06S082 TaxID=3110248 RepID=UPI002B1FED8F|nr:FAD-dependent oxidoreductase [Spirulina sp. 06S082]MEA5470087.1 FAD-dependent oxidoreductase [Spirulina sp. 06S082]
MNNKRISSSFGIKRRNLLYLLLGLSGSLGMGSCSQLSAEPGKNESETNLYDTVIIGGGISGLTAAFLLKEKNILVLEKETSLGGRIVSGEWEGFHYPKGTEYIGEPEGESAQLFSQLGLKAIKMPPPTDAIAYQGSIHHGKNILDFIDEETQEDYWRLEEELSKLNDRIEDDLFSGLGDRNVTPLKQFAGYDGQTMAEWLKQLDIDPVIQQYIDIENRGLFGAANNELSLLFNIPEMAYNLPDPEEANESEVYTFSRGIYELVEVLAQRLAKNVVTGAKVNQVEVNEEEEVTVSYEREGKEVLVKAKTVILSTPAPISDRLVTQGFSNKVKNALKSIQYAEYVTVNLFLRDRLWKDAWTLSCLDDFFVTLYDAIRTQVDISYNGKAVLGVYIAAKDAKDRSLLKMSDVEIVDRVLKDLEKYYPNIRSQVLGQDIQRFPYAFPAFSRNYTNILEVLYTDKMLQNSPLFLAGDYLVYATLDGAIASGFQAAESVNEYITEN